MAIFYKVLNGGPDGKVWSRDLAEWVDESLVDYDPNDPYNGTDVITYQENIAELIETLHFNGAFTGDLEPDVRAGEIKSRYYAARSEIENGPIGVALKDYHDVFVVRALKSSPQSTDAAAIRDEYFVKAGEMKTTLATLETPYQDEINGLSQRTGYPQTTIRVVPETPTPDPAKACSLCDVAMVHVVVWGQDVWECPICGHRVSFAKAYDVQPSEQLGSRCPCMGPFADGPLSANDPPLEIQIGGLAFRVTKNTDDQMATLAVRSAVSGVNFTIDGLLVAFYSLPGDSSETWSPGAAIAVDRTTTDDTWHIVASNLGRGVGISRHDITIMDANDSAKVYVVRAVTTGANLDVADICNLSANL